MSRRKFNFTIIIVLGLTAGIGHGAPAQDLARAQDSARAQDPAPMQTGKTPHPPLYLGTKTPYAAPDLNYTAPPAGYSPVFINYVGRHGARFLTKAGADLRVWEVLQAAEKDNALTATGKQVKVMTERLLAVEKDKYEQITLLGGEEQTALGERMLYQYAPVFTGKGLDVVTTYKLRTQQSAAAFLKGLAKVPGERRYAKAPDTLDAVLRFYDLSPAYQRYKKSAALRHSLDSLDQDKRTKTVALQICRALFTPGFAQKMQAPAPKETEAAASKKAPAPKEASPKTTSSSKKANDAKESSEAMTAVSFAENLYDLYSVQFSLPGEIREKGYPKDSVDLGIAFEKKDLEWLDYKSGAQDFLEKGPAFNPLGIQVQIAAPLLVDFINSTEQVIRAAAAEPRPDAILRFTHAEAISPFAALLGIPQASQPALSIYNYQSGWQTASVIPLSANIQWVLYSNGKDWLVKALLNEKESALPVPTRQYPYYRWEDLKDFYIKRLKSIHTGLQDNMHDYLKTLK